MKTLKRTWADISLDNLEYNYRSIRAHLPQASVQYELKAPQAGYIHHMDAQKIGESSAILGAGRKTKDDVIDPAAGIVLKEKTGAKVEQGQTLAVLHTDRPETLADAERVFLEAIRWGADAPAAQPLIYGIVTE